MNGIGGINGYGSYFSSTVKKPNAAAELFKTQMEAQMQNQAACNAASAKGANANKIKDQVSPFFDPDVTSAGDQKLTPEQIADLTERYDITNISEEDFSALLLELHGMNVIATKDVAQSQIAMFDMKNNGVITRVEGNPATNMIDRYTQRISGDLQCGNKELAAAHERLLEILKELWEG